MLAFAFAGQELKIENKKLGSGVRIGVSGPETNQVALANVRGKTAKDILI